MTQPSNHGATTRRPLVYGGRVYDPRLKERTRKDGTKAYDARLRIDGVDRTVTFRDAVTPTDAVHAFENLLAARNRGTVNEEDALSPTVAAIAAEWLEHARARVGIADERRRFSSETVRMRASVVEARILPRLGHKSVANVTTGDVRSLIDALGASGLSPASVTGTVSILSVMLTFAAKRGYVGRNVVRDLAPDDRPGSKRLTAPRYLTVEQVERLLAAGSEPYRTVWTCCAYAGLRINEALGLRWKDVDLNGGRLTVAGQHRAGVGFVAAKTSRSHGSLPLFPALARELTAHRARQAKLNIALIGPDQYVFTRPATGRPWSHQSAREHLHAVARRIGLDDGEGKRVTPHDLRHSFVALAIESGATIPEVAELARHTSPATTLRAYAGLTEDGRGRAAAKLLASGFGA